MNYDKTNRSTTAGDERRDKPMQACESGGRYDATGVAAGCVMPQLGCPSLQIPNTLRRVDGARSLGLQLHGVPYVGLRSPRYGDGKERSQR